MLSGAKTIMQDMMMINKATATTNTPVSGVQLSEISSATKDSAEHCKSICDQLSKRIEKDNVTIKYKCFKIIAHLMDDGHENFCKEMSTHIDVMKTCVTFTGAPDQLRGMEPYNALHNVAQETIANVMARATGQTPAFAPRQANALFGGPVKPVAPSAQSAGLGGHQQQGPPKKEMVGLGSGSYGAATQPAAAKVSWMDKAKNLGSNAPAQEAAAPLATAAAPTSSTSAPLQASGTPGYNYASNVGPAAVGQPNYAPPKSTAQMYRQNAGSANTDGTYERGLVNELCMPGGMRPIPPADKLEQFCRHCRTLDPLLVGPMVLTKLNEENWQTQMKGLGVIEGLAKHEGCEAYVHYFQENTQEIDYLISGGKPQVQKRADEVKKRLFGVEAAEDSYLFPLPPFYSRPAARPAAVAQAAAAPVNPTEDLFASVSSVPAAAPALAAAVPDMNQMNDMFSGMSMSSAPAAAMPQAPAATQNVFGDLDFGTSQPASSAASSASKQIMQQGMNPAADNFGAFDYVPKHRRRTSSGASANAFYQEQIPVMQPNGMQNQYMPPGVPATVVQPSILTPGMMPPGMAGMAQMQPGMMMMGQQQMGMMGQQQMPQMGMMGQQQMPQMGMMGQQQMMPQQMGMMPQQMGMMPQQMGMMPQQMGMAPAQQPAAQKKPDQFSHLLPMF